MSASLPIPLGEFEPFASRDEVERFAPLIFALYTVGLDRAPDEAGLAALVHALRHGMALDQAAEGILDSEEFRRRTPPEAREGVSLVRYLGAALSQDRLVATLEAATAGEAPAQLLARLAREAASDDAAPLFARLYPGGAALDDQRAYRRWVDAYGDPTPDDIEIISRMGPPRITVSVCLVVGDGPLSPTLRTIRSLNDQLWGDWQLCLATEPRREALRDALARAGMAPIKPCGTNLAHAVEAATGTFLMVLQPGDVLAPDALAELHCALQNEPDLDLVFADEDSMAPDGKRSAPRFKPGWSVIPLTTGDSVGGPAFLRRSCITGPGSALDMIRQVAFARPKAVRHIPAILLHRATPGPIATGCEARVWTNPAPLVSIMIPTRDRADLLGPCVEGILHRTAHQASEILLVDTGSVEPAALMLLEKLALDPRTRVLRRPGPFNWSAVNNAAAAEARGAVLLFLNNDTVVTEPGWLGELAGQAMQPGIGIVGARLLYPDGRLQHGGVALGPRGRATHIQRFAPAADAGYLGQLAVPRDVGAVTGACMAIPRSAFDALGGFEAENLTLEWSDIEICIRARAEGLRVLWTPHATLLHLESATRTSNPDLARLERARAEQAWVVGRWPEAMECDPFLNPNLLMTDDAVRIAPMPRRRRPWLA